MNELKDKNGNIIREPRNCKYCGDIYDASLEWAIAIEDGSCFSCWFWDDMRKRDAENPARVVIVDGGHYCYDDDVKDRWMAGFSGSKFHIKFNDGREVITHNLWYQGIIPERVKEHFPNNAVFITKEGQQ